MRYIVRLILILAALGAVAVLGYAYFGDLSPRTEDVTVPVTLDGN